MPALNIKKFSIPIINCATIYRNELIHMMDKMSSCGILYVHAPAGYGKTTATVQWIGSKKYKAAWLSLDSYDTASGDFYKGLLATLSSFTDIDTQAVIYKVLDNDDYSRATIHYLLGILPKLRFKVVPDMIVIDDFHFCQDKVIMRSLSAMQDRLPAAIKLVILSRNPPFTEIYGSIVKGALKEITLNELQFSQNEIADFFKINGMALSDYRVERLREQTLGWPAALSTLILSHDSGNRGSLLGHDIIKITDNNSLQEYIKSQIYEYWDAETRDMLIKISICDSICPELFEIITEQKNGWKTLTELSHKTGLIMKLDSNTYQYHQLLRDFLLSELESDKKTVKIELYLKASKWYMENDELLAALDMAAKSGNVALVEEIQRKKDIYGQFNIGVESYAEAIDNNVLCKFPMETLEKLPRFSIERFISAFVLGKLDETVKWMAIVNGHLMSGRITQPADIMRATLQAAICPQEGSWNVIKTFRNSKLQIPKETSGKAMYAFSLTFNLPFFHKAQRDYTDIAPELDKFLEEARKFLAPCFGPVYEQLALLCEAGVCFEQNNIVKAQILVEKALKLAVDSTPEIRFSSRMLLCEIYWYKGMQVELNKMLYETDKMISETNSFYLAANFNSYLANLSLYSGDVNTAKEWLAAHSNFDKLPIKFYKCFENLTTARALMVLNNLPKAIDFLDKICKFSELYRRNTDLIEASTLRGICFWRMKDTENALKNLNAAIIRAKKYEISMSIIKEGADVIPILHKILNRLKFGYDCEILDKPFVSMLYLNAHTVAGYYEGLFSKTPNKPIKLSERQALILKMMSQKLTHKEMSETIGIKVTSVREHVNKLYEKLDVTNSHDALLKAIELGFLEM